MVFVKVAGFRKGMTELVASLTTIGIKFFRARKGTMSNARFSRANPPIGSRI